MLFGSTGAPAFCTFNQSKWSAMQRCRWIWLVEHSASRCSSATEELTWSRLKDKCLKTTFCFRFIAMPNSWIQYLIGWTNNGTRLWTNFWFTLGTMSFLCSVYLPLLSKKKTPMRSIGLTIFCFSSLPQCLVKLSIGLLLRTAWD